MSNSKHTPGPWYSMPYSLQVTDKKMWFDEDGSRHGDTPNMILDCLTEADCHLIAAAPDMLAALQGYVDAFEHHFITNTHGARDFDFTGHIAAQARAAIAKATGDTK